VNYDRTHIESLKQKEQVRHFPYLKVFVILAVLVFGLLSIIH